MRSVGREPRTHRAEAILSYSIGRRFRASRRPRLDFRGTQVVLNPKPFEAMMGGGGMQQPGVFVLNKNTKREQGRKAQLTNIAAGKTVASIVRTTLGPKAMLKMLLDPMGGIVMTNDGNAILREIDVTHPAAKNMIELSRAQDEEVGVRAFRAQPRLEKGSGLQRARQLC